MRVLPVIDLLGGQVVRGIAGKRREYRPVESVLCEGAQPLVVAGALREKLGLDELYLADLDAIEAGQPAWDLYQQLCQAGFHLWIDAGLKDVGCCQTMMDFAQQAAPISIIAGLETLASPDVLESMLAIAGPARLVFSLDLKNGIPLTSAPAWEGLSPQEIADRAIAMGVERFILLDLARVGVGMGVGTEALCRYVRKRSPTAQIVSGGGVRSQDDLKALAKLGCDAVLVASALHDGRIGRQQCDAVAG